MISSESTPYHQVPQAYLLLRVGMGLCFAIHGALRFGQVNYFNELVATASGMEIYDSLLILYAFVMPAAEIIAGILLCLGFLKRTALSSLSVIMIIWILSSILLEFWSNMASQLLFFFILYWLHYKIGDDDLSFDNFLRS